MEIERWRNRKKELGIIVIVAPGIKLRKMESEKKR